MGPPRRTLTETTTTIQQSPSAQYSSPSQHRQQPRLQPTMAQSPDSSFAMSPTSIYNHNLKVLRRRDPSIVTIFDQFSHVCVYHHNGVKWEKQGFEGSMFLYERNSYPPYGFYILNRVGMDDYIQRIYPEDIVTSSGSYLIIRSFPEYSAQRVANVQASASQESLGRFSDAYAVPENLQLKDKERSQVVGLWYFANAANREPMIDVMKRLHSYITKNLSYPDEYKYGPDKPPPPPNPNQSATRYRTRSMLDRGSDASDTQQSNDSQSDSDHPNSSANHSPPSMNPGASEIDLLFAKITPATAISHTLPHPQSQTRVSTSNVSVNNILPTLVNNNNPSLFPLNVQTTSFASQYQPVPMPTNTTGISLLDSIFASASANSTPAPSMSEFTFPSPPAISQPKLRPPTILPQANHIISPTPMTNNYPQILDQDVISTLLGLPPSRAPSVASTAYSSHPSSREGDNEDDGEDDDIGTQASPGVPHVPETALKVNQKGRINGDVTPRAPLYSYSNGSEVRSRTLEQTLSLSTVRPDPQDPPSTNGITKPRANRTLVPFEADSELWPYPRAPVDDGSGSTNEDSDIVELDFEDTSALSDMEQFKKALNRKTLKTSLPNGHTNGNESGRENMREKGKAGKKEKRREKNAREREAIERSWDVPPALSSAPQASTLPGPNTPQSLPTNKMATPVQKPVIDPLDPDMPTPTLKAKPKPGLNLVNSAQIKPKKPTATINKEEKIDVNAARESLVDLAAPLLSRRGTTGRNEFVRDVLTLIHTDQSFVESLWNQYLIKVEGLNDHNPSVRNI